MIQPVAIPAPPPLPQFTVALTPPDLAAWEAGNSGIPGIITLDSGQPGPHTALVSLIHGNEIAGAIALDRLLRAGLRPSHGKLSLGFANLAAYARFDPRQPTASRFVDEDLNRVWDRAVLDGPRRSSELDRARALRPWLHEVDILLDLHSMLWPSDALILCGRSAKGRALAAAIGTPSLSVSDQGHLNGPRLIDYAPFVDAAGSRAAVLVESGQHWQPETVEVTLASIAGLLRHTGQVTQGIAHAPIIQPPPRQAEVTLAVTATTGQFGFVQPFRGGDVLPRRNTLIAVDGTTEIRTPHDACLLVMPSLRPSRGHTAVRLGRFVGP